MTTQRIYVDGQPLIIEVADPQKKFHDVLSDFYSVLFGALPIVLAVAADRVGGDFYDIFEADSGKIVIVLGGVSGKGLSAALPVSVLQGAIRSPNVSQHEFACERINRMLCERNGVRGDLRRCFWGVFDSASGTLRYVNAAMPLPCSSKAISIGTVA